MPKAAKSIRSKNWLLTIFDLTKSLEDYFKQAQCKYLIGQTEQCPSTERRHYQVYLEFHERKTFGKVKKLFPGAHIECRRGSQIQAINYCSKEETRVTEPERFGEPAKQGERNDLLEVKDMLDGGTSLHDVADSLVGFPVFLKYHKALERYITMTTFVPRTVGDEVEVRVYWGPSGSGKTRRANEEAPGAYQLPRVEGSQTVWWDNYEGQQTCIIDDFYGWLRWDYMLRLLDRYPMQVQYKGGMAPMCVRKFWITSNSHPKDWYHNVPNGDLTPLLRRITHIEKIE